MSRQPQVDELLASYPRRRPELPEAYRQSYVEHYRGNRSGGQGLSRIVMRLEAWMHRQVAQGGCEGRLLEIGAGNLNHVAYHPRAAVYDAVEPFRELWQDSPYRARVRQIYDNVANMPAEPYYDAVVSIAVLEHLTDLPAVMAAAALRLREGGSFRAGFPSEGGLAWGLGWRLTTGLEYRLKRGLDYAALMRHEHVNTAAEIAVLLRYFFARVEISRFPLPSAHLSFYTAADARGPRLERCLRFCSRPAVQDVKR
jgi:SAM-dependent methyltransferase